MAEDVAALVAEAREHNVWEGSHDDLRDLLDRLAAALEVSSRTVAPNREASIETIRQVILSKSWSREKGTASTVAWPGLATEVFDTLLAADLWQPAPVIDRDALAKVLDDAGYESANHNWSSLNLADALLASGWQPASPRTVTTVEELDALPVGSVIRSKQGYILERLAGLRWYRPGIISDGYPTVPTLLPASVLYVPSEGVQS